MSGDAEPRLAPYACRAAATRGRRVDEAPSATRTAFQRDRDRIVHSSAFRRLSLKTQVFLPDAGDHYRTRLTHTLEVAQIARTIARALALDEDLTEALALAHDLGHPPFGHTGEAALDACVAAAGGFDHNVQTLRIVTELERRYPAFDGLNLTWETLEGLAKRNGPCTDLPGGLAALEARYGFGLSGFPGAEAQVAAVADDIAYNAHDLEDGLDAGLFDLADLDEVPFVAETLRAIAAAHPALDRHRVIRELTRTMVGAFVEDAVAESRRRLGAAAPPDSQGVRDMTEPAVALTAGADRASRDVKAFLYARMYRHPDLARVRLQAAEIVRDLAQFFIARPDRLPPERAAPAAAQPDPRGVMRIVADHVAAMTDRAAVSEHRRCFGRTPDLR